MLKTFLENIVETQQPTFHLHKLVVDNIEILSDRIEDDKILLFHGTPLENFPKILKDGFDPNNYIYLSGLIVQSIYYQLKYEYTGNEEKFSLLVCSTRLGRVQNIKGVHDKIESIYDSTKCKYTQGKSTGFEYRIKSGDQVTPVAILHLRTLKFA